MLVAVILLPLLLSGVANAKNNPQTPFNDCTVRYLGEYGVASLPVKTDQVFLLEGQAKRFYLNPGNSYLRFEACSYPGNKPYVNGYSQKYLFVFPYKPTQVKVTYFNPTVGLRRVNAVTAEALA